MTVPGSEGRHDWRRTTRNGDFIYWKCRACGVCAVTYASARRPDQALATMWADSFRNPPDGRLNGMPCDEVVLRRVHRS